MSLSLFKKFRNRVVILLLILTPAIVVQSASHAPLRAAARPFVPGVLYVKYRTGGAENASQSASARTLVQQFHPSSGTRPFAMRTTMQPDVQFGSVYKYTFSAPTDVASLAAQLKKNPAVEYAEPSYVHYLDGTNVLPNDPLYANQWHLAKILADTAWSICAGDASIIIGIVDSGTDYLHADLMVNMYINPAEDINHNGKFDNWPSTTSIEGVTGDNDGIDNDGNGYIDDVIGWDFRGADFTSAGDNDPHPYNGNPHGTHVAGIAAAVTNNSTGIASIGNRCRLLVTKHGVDTQGSDEIDFGYEGIIYLVDNGAKIINCSWGVAGGASRFEQDVITYALKHNVLVVAACGNGGSDFSGDDNERTPHFPSSYKGVMGVGATDNSDIKADFSNYGIPTHVKVFAPGTSILSTIPGGGYESFGWSGTSMASPLAAGLAGLVRSRHKDWNAAQIMFQITGTADNLDALNPKYAGKMGYGRINALRALTNTVPSPGPDLDLLSVTIDDHTGGNGDGILDPGETVKLFVTIQNSWGDAHGVQASIAFDPSVQWGVNVTHAVSSLGDVSGLMVPDSSVRTNVSDPIIVALSSDLFPMVLPYTLTVSANGGFSKQWKGSLSLSSRILLVDDDDGSNNIESYYTSLLNRANLMYDYWDHHIQGTPAVDLLKKYSTVIWACEWAFPSLDSTDRASLAQFLDQGGRLFISGQDIGWDLADPQDAGPSEYNDSHGASNLFYEKYLHAKYVADDGISPNIAGVAGDPIGDTLNFVRYQPGRASSEQFGDVVIAINGSSAIFKVKGGTFFDDSTTAVRYDGVHKVVYFAFGGLESIIDSLIRREVLRRTMKWLGGYEISVDVLTDRETAADPLVVTAAVTANSLNSVSLYWSPNGSRPFQRTRMRPTPGGRSTATIPAQPVGTSIEYFVLAKAGSDYLPYDIHQFTIAPDRVPPAIVVADTLRNTMQWSGAYACRAVITDQNGIDTAHVILHYRIGAGAEQQAPMHRTTNPDEFEGAVVSTDRLSSGDVIMYYITAIDNSLQKNTGRYPVGRELSFFVGKELVDDFEMPLDTIQRWNPGVWKRTSDYKLNGSYSITDSPDGDYVPNSNNVLALKRTYDLSMQSKAVVRFAVKYEIDLSDTLYVEASNDPVHWSVLSGFNGTTFPFASLRKMNTDLGKFCGVGNEYVAIRFRLHADGAVESDGAYIDDVEVQTGSLIVAVNAPESVLPRETKLESNYPNPFNPSTTISYSLKEGSWTVLMIFDAMGREVETLCNSFQPSGNYTVTWNAAGRASGVYFCRLVAGSYAATGRLLFLK